MVHSYELESGIINRIFYSGQDCSVLIDVLEPDDFYSEQNRKVFGAIKSAHGKNLPIDEVSIAYALDGDIIEPAKFIVTTYQGAYTSDPDWALRELKQLRAQRDIAVLMDRKARELSVGKIAVGIDIEAQNIADRIVAIKERQTVTRWRSSKEVALDVYDILTDESRKKSSVKLGYSKLDYNIGRISGGKLVTIAGRPGQGKTSFALDLIKHWCHLGIKTGLLTLEMSSEEIYYALIAKFGKVSKDIFRNPDQITPFQWDIINQTLESIATWPLSVYDRGSKNFDYIKTIIRRMASEGVQVVVIDQLSRMEQRGESVRESYSIMVDALKNLAGEIDIPIFLLCQVNRESDKESDKYPKVWQLKNTGTIEETSDIIIMVHLPYEYTKDEEDRCKANIIIGKNRNGSTGIYRMSWSETRCAFEE